MWDRRLRLYAVFALLALAAALGLVFDADRRFWWVQNVFHVLFVQQDGWGIGLSIGIVTAALLWPGRSALAALPQWAGQRVGLMALAAFAVSAAGAVLAYHTHPLAFDEFSPLFQARIFAAGRIHGQLPPALLDQLVPFFLQKSFFTVSHTTGAIVSNYWPGFALLLVPGVWAGVPWLVNPLLAALSMVLIAAVASRIFGAEDHARRGWAMLLLLVSPVFTVNAMSYYSMPAHLCLNLLFTWLVLTPTPGRLLAAGLCGSLALTLHNPLPHFLYALPWLVWLGRQRKPLGKVALLGVGYVPLVLLLGVGWWWVKREIHGLDAVAAAGQAATAGGSGPLMIAVNGLLGTVRALKPPTWMTCWFRMVGLAKMIAWEMPGLLALACMGLVIGWRQHVALRVLAACAVLTFAGYFLSPFNQGHGWGYRYFHPALATLPLLAAAVLPGRGDEDEAARAARSRFAGTVVVVILFSLVLATSLRAAQVRSFMDQHLWQLPPHDDRQPTIVFLHLSQGYYLQDLLQNDPFLRGNVLYMVSLGDERNLQAAEAWRPGETWRIRRFPTGSVWTMMRSGP